MDPILLMSLDQVSAGAVAVPDWVHLVPAGTFRGVDGRGPYTLDVDAVLQGFEPGARLPIDENHSIDLAAPKGGPSPARGWIVALEARADGIWGRVEWTAAGRQLVAEGAYRAFSPAIVADKATGRIVGLARASLVNSPNLKLTTLHQRTEMDLLARLRAALGLTADVDEDAVVAAATSARTAISAHAAELARIATAAGVAAEGATADGLVTHLQARVAEGDPAELRQTVITLQTRLDALQSSAAKDAATRYVDKAIADGKPILPLRDHYITRHAADPVAVAKEIDGLPSIHGGGRVTPPGGGEAGRLSDAGDQVVRLMGLDPAAYAKTETAMKQEAL